MAETKILIITREVQFATNAIAALEKVGYKVTTFTNSRPAVDFLRQNPQDLAVLDFRVNDMPAPDTIDHMRAMQPNIGVIAAPNHPAVHDLQEKHNLLSIINIPYPLRRFVEVLESALQKVQEAQQNNLNGQSGKLSDTGKKRTAAIEFWVSDSDNGDTVVEYTPTPAKVDKPDDLKTQVFDILAAEEPPMPAFDEGSTVRDLRDQLSDPQKLRRYLEVFSDDSTARNAAGNVPGDTPQEESRSIPAALILETAMDESTPQSFTINEFMSRVQESGKQILVPPSWLQEAEKYLREPDFLSEDLPSIPNTFEYTVTKTTPNEAQKQIIPDDPTNLVTDQLEPVARSRPLQSLLETPDDRDKSQLYSSEMPADTAKGEPVSGYPSPPPLPEMPQPMAELLDEDEAAQHAADFEKIKSDPKSPKVPEKAVLATIGDGVTERGVPFADHDKTNPYIAQLALTLTQVSLELTAEAAVLAYEGEIIAYAGNLPIEDIESLREQLQNDWNAEGEKSRIRFIMLPGSGEDYMLFTRQTASGHTLSMIFGGKTPLHVIRRQGKRLGDALATVPEPLLEPETSPEEQATAALQIPSDEEVGERAPRTLVWMLRNLEDIIPDDIARKIGKGLNRELVKSGWLVHDLEVHQDFVYIFGDMPIRSQAKLIIRDLMQAAAYMVADDTDFDSSTLWDSSYLVLQPGRKLDIEEIQRFINFARE